MRLKKSVSIECENDCVNLTYGNYCFRINDVSDINHLKDVINSNKSLSVALADHGFIRSENVFRETTTIDALDFYQKHKEFAMSLLEEVYDHKIWTDLVSEESDRSLILGFALEKYHYIEGAHEHMAYAAANSTTKMMPHLARHFIEEYTHGDIYKYGLSSFFSPEQIEKSTPLPTTRSLINILNEFAMENSFCYYAANEVLQLTENVDSEDEGEIGDFYNLLIENNKWAEPLVKSFRAHTTLDQNLGHEESFLEMCRSEKTLSLETANLAFSNTRKIVEHLKIFLDGISNFYSGSFSPLRTADSIVSRG